VEQAVFPTPTIPSARVPRCEQICSAWFGVLRSFSPCNARCMIPLHASGANAAPQPSPQDGKSEAAFTVGTITRV